MKADKVKLQVEFENKNNIANSVVHCHQTMHIKTATPVVFYEEPLTGGG